MLSVFTSCRPTIHRVSTLLVGLLCLSAPLVLSAHPDSNGGNDRPILSSNSAASAWFTILEMKPVGDQLYVSYKVRYPGMVKVRLYEGDSEEPVWRGQYVNREEGVHNLRFNTHMMKRGLEYRFEFDYKNHIVPRFFTP